MIVAAAIAHAFAEVLSQAGGWGLSFELADPVRAGTYQGVFSMGYSLGAMVSPLFVTSTALTLGFGGWAILAPSSSHRASARGRSPWPRHGRPHERSHARPSERNPRPPDGGVG